MMPCACILCLTTRTIEFSRWLFRTSCASFLVTVLFCGADAAQAQTQAFSASPGGYVRDASGAGVPGTRVTLTSPEKGITRTFRTGTEGKFSVTLPPPETYALSAEAVNAYQKLAIMALTRASEAAPASPRMHLLLGDAYGQKDMFRGARAEYSKALELGRDKFPALLGLAATAYRESTLDDALSSIKAALDLRPNDGEASLLAGEILIGQRQYAAAEPYVKASLGVKPALLPRVHALLGPTYIATGKEGLPELKQGVASDDEGSVYYQLGRAYKALGDERSAEGHAEVEGVAQQAPASCASGFGRGQTTVAAHAHRGMASPPNVAGARHESDCQHA